jgi:hypothetical protein
MTRAKMCELAIILNDLESTLKIMQEQKEWLPLSQFGELVGMSGSTIQQFKDREAFEPYRMYTKKRCLIKNCPEAIKLMRCYKYRNFEYEQELLEKQKASEK